jgi:hypothetical protein
MSGPYDTAVVRWAKGRVRVGTAAATNSREAYLEVVDLTSEQQATEYGTAWLAAHAGTVDQVDLGIQPTTSEMTPWDGIGNGDALRYTGRDGTTERGRIHGVGFAGIRRNGEPNWTVTLGSASQERGIVARRQLSGLTQGTMAGTFKAGAVAIAPSFAGVPTSALPKRTLRIADTDALSEEAPYDRTKPLPFDEAESIIRWECACESLVGSADSEFEIWRVAWSTAGTIIARSQIGGWTWPGDRYRFTHVSDHLFLHGQGMQIVVTTAGAHNLVTIQPISSSAN